MALELQKLSFATAAAFRLWLEANHEKSPGIWLMIAKQARGVDSVTYNEAVDQAICFGWIDGQKAKHDDTYFSAALHASIEAQRLVGDQYRTRRPAGAGEQDDALGTQPSRRGQGGWPLGRGICWPGVGGRS
jgi:hypothetical protein